RLEAVNDLDLLVLVVLERLDAVVVVVVVTDQEDVGLQPCRPAVLGDRVRVEGELRTVAGLDDEERLPMPADLDRLPPRLLARHGGRCTEQDGGQDGECEKAAAKHARSLLRRGRYV